MDRTTNSLKDLIASETERPQDIIPNLEGTSSNDSNTAKLQGRRKRSGKRRYWGNRRKRGSRDENKSWDENTKTEIKSKLSTSLASETNVTRRKRRGCRGRRGRRGRRQKAGNAKAIDELLCSTNNKLGLGLRVGLLPNENTQPIFTTPRGGKSKASDELICLSNKKVLPDSIAQPIFSTPKGGKSKASDELICLSNNKVLPDIIDQAIFSTPVRLVNHANTPSSTRSIIEHCNQIHLSPIGNGKDMFGTPESPLAQYLDTSAEDAVNDVKFSFLSKKMDLGQRRKTKSAPKRLENYYNIDKRRTYYHKMSRRPPPPTSLPLPPPHWSNSNA